MPNPVPIPSGPLTVSPSDIQRAEELLSAIVQVIHAGTSGASPATYPTLIPTADPTVLQPLALASDVQQQQYRQLAVAIAKVVSTWSVGPEPDPDPPDVIDPLLVSALCDVTVTVGDVVCASNGVDRFTVEKANPRSPNHVPAIGIVVSKENETSCKVRVGGALSDVFYNLIPGKVYFLGYEGTINDSPLSPVGETIYSQEIGIALDSTNLLVAPSPNIIEVRR